jgi:hypothetical protein
MIITHNGTILTNDGVVLNNITTSPSFPNTYSLDFDGVSDRVDVGTSLNLGINSTISLWVKRDNVGVVEVVLGEDSYAFDYLLLFNTDNSIFFRINTIYLQFKRIDGAIRTIMNQTTSWVNVVVVRTGDSAELFLNGNSMQTISGFGVSVDTRFDIIGSKPDGSFATNALIDEVSAWNTNTINPSDIYNGGTPNNLTPLNPLAWYRMGDNGLYKDPQWLIPNNENKDKVSNYSMAFDGVNDYINIADNTIIGRTQNISYSVWVNLESLTNRQYIVGNWSSSNNGTGLALETVGGNALVFQIGDGTNDSFFNSRVSNFSTLASQNTWTHILGTWDGTDAKIYINGNLENTWSPSTPYTITNWSSFWVARRVDSASSQVLNGLLTECSLFDTAISISDVWDGSGKPMDVSGVLGITNYWRLGEEATFTYNTPPNGTWNIPDQVGSNPGTSVNLMADSARVGSAPSSSNNALSFNMDLIDRVEDTPQTP